jgi:hypothetical protein
MTLRALIQRRKDKRSTPSVTVTSATPATLDPKSGPIVATVASITVAGSSCDVSVSDPFGDFATAIQSGALQQCRGCRHFDQSIPVDRDNLGVPDAGWCRRYATAAHPLMPFWCDGYSPKIRNV